MILNPRRCYLFFSSMVSQPLYCTVLSSRVHSRHLPKNTISYFFLVKKIWYSHNI